MVRPLVLVALLGGCLADALVPCGDLVCPAGSICAAGECVAPEQLAACQGLAPGTACKTTTIATAICVAGVCEPEVCGDGKIVGAEVCDDGNQIAGDGCAADCRSTEVCGNGIVDGITGEQCDSGVAGLSRDGCTSRCTIEVDAWFPSTPTPPPLIFGEGLAFDAHRHVTVMFGGMDGFGVLQPGTWELSGSDWRRLDPPVTPPLRSAAAMVYDAVRQRVVVFGGAGLNGDLADTWDWDGITWTPRTPSTSPSPSPRSGIGAAFDPVHGNVVLFGDNENPSDKHTWTWDGTSWAEHVTLVGPPSGASLAWDGTRVIGLAMGTSSTETWSWDGTVWTQLHPATVPTVTAVLAGIAGGAIGYAAPASGLLWNGSNWSTIATMPAVYNATVTYDSDRNAAIVTGRNTFGGVFEAYTWKSGTLTKLTQVYAPTGYTDGQQTAYEALTGKILYYGESDETWEYDGVAWLRRAPATPPTLGSHGLVSARPGALAFGDDSGAGETWTWDGTNWTLESPAMSPTSRYGQQMAYDYARDRVVLFGGEWNYIPDAETWEWDGATWQPRAPAHVPPARSYGGITYDPRRGVIVMFGGIDAANNDLADTWEWDGVDWTERAPAIAPAARDSFMMAYDAARARTVLFAGSNPAGPRGDAWEWDGTTWAMLPTIVLPPVRTNAQLAYLGTRDELVAFNGRANAVVYGDTWTHIFTSNVVEIDRCEGIDTDGDGLAGCADPDCWGRCTPMCPPGAPCDSTAPHCGDGTCSPLEDYRLCPADCSP